jgi:hypothetical protein
MGGQSNDAVKLTNSAIVLEFVLVDAAFARSSDIYWSALFAAYL